MASTEAYPIKNLEYRTDGTMSLSYSAPDSIGIGAGPGSSNIIVTDLSKDGLKLYHYRVADEKTPQAEKEYRGVIMDSAGKVICKTFPWSPEYLSSDPLVSKIDLSQYHCYYSVEGTVIRLFASPSSGATPVWRISTHRKIDAFNSHWGSEESFGVIFCKALRNIPKLRELIEPASESTSTSTSTSTTESASTSTSKDISATASVYHTDKEYFDKLCSLLDPKKVYTFMLGCTPRNRIVCSAYYLYNVRYIGTFSADGSEFIMEKDFPVSPPVEVDPRNLTSPELFRAAIENVNICLYQGIICIPKVKLPEVPFIPVKFYNIRYKEYADIRGNVPSLWFRYLQLRNDQEKVKKLTGLYSNFAAEFCRYETILSEIANLVSKTYVARFIQGRYATLEQCFYIFMQKFRKYILDEERKTKTKIFITPELVYQFMDTQNATELNHMIYTYRDRYLQEIPHDEEPEPEKAEEVPVTDAI